MIGVNYPSLLFSTIIRNLWGEISNEPSSPVLVDVCWDGSCHDGRGDDLAFLMIYVSEKLSLSLGLLLS